MRHPLLIVLACAGLCPLAGAENKAPAPGELIAEADRVRNPDQPFSIVTALTEFRDGREIDAMSLIVYSKEDARSGQYRTLALFQAPPRDEGKVMLKNGGELWFHDPFSKASVRISPQQRLMGQASNGDVMTVNLHRDYAATLAGEESITDVSKTQRSCYKLELRPRGDAGNYHRIEYWLDQADARPVKGKFYSDSDRLLKIVYYGGYKVEMGRERPTEAIIIDGVDRKLVTKMVFKAYRERRIPEAWFQTEYLPRFKGE